MAEVKADKNTDKQEPKYLKGGGKKMEQSCNTK
jgi:hypothetical protein